MCYISITELTSEERGMSKYDKLIEKKADSAQYMVDEITHICKDMPKRGDPEAKAKK